MKTTQIRMQQAVVRSGTMCVVQTPEALVGITNNHVLETYERHKAEKHDIFCQLGSAPFDPTDNLISRSQHWDLATFTILRHTLEHFGHEVSAVNSRLRSKPRTPELTFSDQDDLDRTTLYFPFGEHAIQASGLVLLPRSVCYEFGRNSLLFCVARRERPGVRSRSYSRRSSAKSRTCIWLQS